MCGGRGRGRTSSSNSEGGGWVLVAVATVAHGWVCVVHVWRVYSCLRGRLVLHMQPRVWDGDDTVAWGRLQPQEQMQGLCVSVWDCQNSMFAACVGVWQSDNRVLVLEGLSACGGCCAKLQHGPYQAATGWCRRFYHVYG